MEETYVRLDDYFKLLIKRDTSILTFHTIYGGFFVFQN